jgi:hypothetical protein
MSNQYCLDSLIANWWGGTYESDYAAGIISNAANIATGGNPVYYPTDFFAVYPKFAGPFLNPNGRLVEGNNQITSVSSMNGVVLGLFLTAPGLPDGTTITAYDTVGKTITVSNEATASAIQQLIVYAAPLVPVPVVQIYIALAQACVQFNRWLEAWQVAMGWFVAHYLTLYLRTEGEIATTLNGFGQGGFGDGGFGGNTNIAQIAASGLARGVTIAKSSQDVSVTNDLLLNDWGSWGAWNETAYGKQLITMAKSIGFGPMYIW